MALLGDIAYDVFVGVIVALILGIPGYIFRRSLRLRLRRVWYSMTNKQVPVTLVLIRKYAGPIRGPVSHELFDTLKSKVEGDVLALRSISSDTLSINSRELSLDLEMELAPEYDIATIETESPTIIDYKLTVRPRTPVRWGRRDTAQLTHLARLLEKIADTTEGLYLRRGEQPLQQFLLVDYHQDPAPIRKTPEELHDKDLDVQLTVSDNDVRAVLAGPQRLVDFARRNIPS